MKRTRRLLIFLFLCSNRAFAGIGVDPVIIETRVTQGKIVTGTFTVANNENRPRTVQVVVENWLKRKGYKNELSNTKPEEWIEIKPDEFDMEPNSETTVIYSIKIPKGLKGELVAMAFFSSIDKGAFIKKRIGACIYAAIRGTEEVNCEILNTKAVNNNISVELQNTGNVHIRPEGSVVILQEETLIKEVELCKDIPIFPGRTHLYAEAAELPSGVYTAQAIITYGDIFGMSKSLKGEVIEFSIPPLPPRGERGKGVSNK